MTVESIEKILHSKHLSRELAMQYLFRCDMLGELPDMESWEAFFEELKAAHNLRDNRYARKAREYAEELFSGVAVHLEAIDNTIREHAKNWNFERISQVDRNIMRVAVYEMLHNDEVPPVVSIDEAVSIAGDYSGEEAVNFINGVLNGIKNSLKRSPREAVKKSKA